MKLLRVAVLAVSLISLLSSAHAADDWAPNLTADAVWNSNVTKAEGSDDQLDSLLLTADVLATGEYPVSRYDTVFLRAHFAGDWWPRYNALLSGTAGGRAEWQHTFGTRRLAPVVALEGAADYTETREGERRGVHTGVTASLRQRLSERLRGILSHEVSWYDADHATFDRGASQTKLAFEYDITDVARVTLSAGFRDGDVVSYASGLRPDLEALATSWRDMPTFGRPMTAYRIDAKTWSGRIAVVRAIDDTTAVTLAYEHRETERHSLRFSEHLLSIGLVHQY